LHVDPVLIHLGESPERTAFAFAFGVFIAFTPTFGFHYITALLFYWLLRLNLPALLTGTTVNNPLTVAPIYSFCLWIGLLLVGGKEPRQPIDWELSWSLLARLRPLLIPFVVGTLVVGTIAAVGSYWLVRRWLVYRLMRRQWRASMFPTAPPSRPISPEAEPIQNSTGPGMTTIV